MEPVRVPSKYAGAAKMVAVSAVICLASAGLCGVNMALFSKYGAASGGTPEPPRSAGLSGLLMLTGALELGGMGLGVLGILIGGVMALVTLIRVRYAALGSDEDVE